MSASACPDFKFAKPAPKVKVRAKKVKAAVKQQRTVYDEVDTRDKLRCRITGRRANPFSVDSLDRLHHHHILQRGRDQGPTETWNILTVHSSAHAVIHQNELTVEGSADPDGKLRIGLKVSAVEDLFGRRRVPAHIEVIEDEDWSAWVDQHAARTTRSWIKKVGKL